MFVESLCSFDGNTVCYQLAWSRSDPVAALITNTVDEREKEIFSVMFINNEGDILHNSTITNEKEATIMDWQPGGRLLAIGYKDGKFQCCIVCAFLTHPLNYIVFHAPSLRLYRNRRDNFLLDG